jgi:hypothetical protein
MTGSDYRRVFVFADAFSRYHIKAFSVGDAFGSAVNVGHRVRLVEIDGRPADALERFAAAHYVADVRRVGVDRLRVAAPASTVDGCECSTVDTIPATLTALRRWLGY